MGVAVRGRSLAAVAFGHCCAGKDKLSLERHRSAGIRWIIQENLGSSPEISSLLTTCSDLSIETVPVTFLPFSKELPDIPTDKLAVFYGSARFIALAFEARKWRPCAFWSDVAFSYSHWQARYQELLLNNDASVLTLQELATRALYRDDDVCFVRPNRDLKEFAGQLMTVGELRKWAARLSTLGDEGTLPISTEIVIATPKTLHREWRLFMVEGSYSSGSQYRTYDDLNINPTVPEEVCDFAEKAADIWQPADAYVIDICEHQGALKIIEINGFNSTGFYASDIKKIVVDVSEMAERKPNIPFP